MSSQLYAREIANYKPGLLLTAQDSHLIIFMRWVGLSFAVYLLQLQRRLNRFIWRFMVAEPKRFYKSQSRVYIISFISEGMRLVNQYNAQKKKINKSKLPQSFLLINLF